MELRDYLRILRKQLWLIVVAGVLPGRGAGRLAGHHAGYEGTAKLLVVEGRPSRGTSAALEGALLSQQLVKSFAQIIQSRTTAEMALRLDPQPFSPRQLQAKIHA